MPGREAGGAGGAESSLFMEDYTRLIIAVPLKQNVLQIKPQ